MTGDHAHLTNRLAQFVAGTQWEAIPLEVRREGVRGLLNFVGCALGGAHDQAMDIAVKVLTPFFGPPQGIVIGRGERPDALNATFMNAVSANVLEYDDTHLGTVMHPAAPVAPGLFALAALRPVSGRELLHAFIVGVETSCHTTRAQAHCDRKISWRQPQLVEPQRSRSCPGNRQDAARNHRCMQRRSPEPCRRRDCPTGRVEERDGKLYATQPSGTEQRVAV